MTPALSEVAPPLRLVRVGALALSDTLQVQSFDKGAALILGAIAPTVVGRTLLDIIPPIDELITPGTSKEPFSYLGQTPSLSAQVLVSVTQLEGKRLASITSINEYLAESQSLAHVQLRKTVESIIAGFAHEVRNPMAAILSLTEVAMAEASSPDTVLVRIPSLVARVESLLKQALAYSRPHPPRRALHQASFVLDHAIQLLRPRDTPVRIEVVPSNDIPPVMVDLGQGEQVLVNLLENALDAAASVVRVKVRDGKTKAPSVCIEISDDGAGIASDVIPRIFDPFFTTKAQGTGLGLAIARDLARLNGGDLRLAGSSNGATFQMFLPSTQVPLLGPEPE